MAESTPATDDETPEELARRRHVWDRRCNTIFRIRFSILYHLKRRAFFDAIDKWVSVLTALSATAAVAVLLKDSGKVELWGAGVTAVLALIPTVVNPAMLARDHGDLVTRFRMLLVECEKLGEHWEDHHCNHFAGEVVEIEASEAAPLNALVADCQNQLSIANGEGNKVCLRWHQRQLKHFFEFDAARLAAQEPRRWWWKSQAGTGSPSPP